jgi:hypothetical protein
MSSKKQPRNLHSNKTERKSGLSRHYRQIGIKAVAAATRKENSPPQHRRLDGDKRQNEQRLKQRRTYNE